jgi:hypothetical protein
LEPPYSGPYQVISRKEKTLRLLVWGKPISVNRQGHSGIHIQRGRLYAHRLQLSGQNNAYHSTAGYTTSHITASSYPQYEFRSSCPILRTLQHLSNHLWGGVMWEPPTWASISTCPLLCNGLLISFPW